MSEANVVEKFYSSSKDKFKTKRQASKYLMGFGSVYKTEKEIPLEYSKRTMLEVANRAKSDKNIKSKKKR